ncbi:MAG: type I methionyl aminopeptidase [Aeromicrobium sp.]|uniref:type I methionyl aminopeptidase n=1 Tax=Aeromicrobium sp. TaxID=1871063 RepID=UPI0039E2B750
MFGPKIEYKTPAQIAIMRRAGVVVADVLATVREAAVPGVTTGDLDQLAREVIARHGATSNFLGYHGFPGVICTSVNEEVVHTIPGSRELREGDLLSVDAGAVVDGWHGDAAVTVEVGEVDPADAELSRVTEAALWAGIEAAQVGARLGDVGHAIESVVRAAGDYGIVQGFTGHGIGTAMHQDPDVPNEGQRGKGLRLKPGLVIAVEPMVSRGSPHTRILDDEWTAVTVDGSRAAHWEHTVALTPDGPQVLTLPA